VNRQTLLSIAGDLIMAVCFIFIGPLAFLPIKSSMPMAFFVAFLTGVQYKHFTTFPEINMVVIARLRVYIGL